MADSDWLAVAFEEHRAHLRAVAYRMLGSITDADDAVQDAWLRVTSANTSEVENLGGWLTTIVARVSLNMLRSRRSRQEEPFADSWPGTGAGQAVAREATAAGPGAVASTGGAGDPEEEAVLADSVGLALLVVLDTLTPAERLAFVLHDMFAMPFTEVAAVLDRSTEATRQLASRARRRVRGAPGAPGPGHAVDRAREGEVARQREVASAFLTASRGGDLSALLALLDPDVTLTADGYASPSGKAVRLRGVEAVGRGAVAASGRAGMSQLALVNGAVGIVFAPAGRLQGVLRMTVGTSGLITMIDVIADPGRLQELRLAVLPD
ncbi:MAG TPA: sigma-70 family RNA polymerase sigma factor [Streptosporangiaceae bacterium]|nr:sigma-70 family RNA polymerase sigma factor [Streptosporangiaceae bacterium]